MIDNNAVILASGILNTNPESNREYPHIGEVMYIKRFDAEIVEILIFRQGIVRLTPDGARELVKELADLGFTAEDD